ncbi:MAG: hypothetical protein H0T76_28970 [Nannocystis sp.]|nr:hypothetical protein [Nannocystis sp.]MBA3550527.1 hypothetical protein [Nannocystis sp.]
MPTTGSPSTGLDPASTADEPGTSSGSTSTSGSEEATTVAPDPEACGNSVLDPGEQCDLGFGNNADDSSPCTQACQTAFCGDGLVWTGHETCDLGPNNNDATYGGCTQACEWGPRCNDGILQPEEECDASAEALEGAVDCDPDNCRFKARVAFVTAATFSGAFGGLAGADAACVAAALEAGLDNAAAFQAWLSDGEAAPAARLVKATKDPLPYARRDGKQLAYSLADLTTQGMDYPLDRTEYGLPLPPEQYAWTNVTPKGQPFSPTDHCQAWTSPSFKNTARIGQISPKSAADLPGWYIQTRWSSYLSRPCADDEQHLYCFED